MKNYKIIWGLVAVLAFIGIIFYAKPEPGKPGEKILSAVKSNSVLQAEEANFDFGSISMSAGKVSHQFKIKNTGAEAIVINKMYTSCMCTTALLSNKAGKFGPFGMPGHATIEKIDAVIEPGEEALVEAVFDPNAHGPAGVGKIERVIVLENNSGDPVELGFLAYVTP